MTKKTYQDKITHARLQEIVAYDTDSGELWPIEEGASSVFEDKGYLYMKLDGKKYLASNVAFFYHRGRWPTGRVKFVDGDHHFLSVWNLQDDNGPLNQPDPTVNKYLMSPEELSEYDRKRAEAKFLADMEKEDDFFDLEQPALSS